jgi:hypothetical protein
VRRLLAILGATAMVVTAVVARNALDDGGGGGRAGDDEVVMLCDPDLRAACEAATASGARVIVRDSAEVAAALVAGQPDASVDGWITTAAWLEVVRSRLDQAPDQAPGQATVLATSDIVVAVDQARSEALAAHCGDDPAWRCLGDAAGTPWADLGGDVRWGGGGGGGWDVEEAAAAVEKVSSLQRESCRQEVESRFSDVRMAGDYLEVYRQILKK